MLRHPLCAGAGRPALGAVAPEAGVSALPQQTLDEIPVLRLVELSALERQLVVKDVLHHDRGVAAGEKRGRGTSVRVRTTAMRRGGIADFRRAAGMPGRQLYSDSLCEAPFGEQGLCILLVDSVRGLTRWLITVWHENLARFWAVIFVGFILICGDF